MGHFQRHSWVAEFSHVWLNHIIQHVLGGSRMWLPVYGLQREKRSLASSEVSLNFFNRAGAGWRGDGRRGSAERRQTRRDFGDP